MESIAIAITTNVFITLLGIIGTSYFYWLFKNKCKQFNQLLSSKRKKDQEYQDAVKVINTYYSLINCLQTHAPVMTKCDYPKCNKFIKQKYLYNNIIQVQCTNHEYSNNHFIQH